MLIKLRLDVIRVCRAHDLLSTEGHQIGNFGLDVEVGVFSHEWNPCDRPAGNLDSLHLAYLHDVFETDIAEHQLHRRIDQFAAGTPGHDDILDLAPQL